MKNYTEARSKVQLFYRDLLGCLGEGSQDVVAVVVCHMVPNALSFLPALNELVRVGAVLPKPKSTSREEYGILSEKFNMHELDREWASDADSVLNFLNLQGLQGSKVVFVDIGGYFADSISEVADRFSGTILGVLEGTENGVQKYEKSDAFSVAGPSSPHLITVARSPLKLPEDYLVASSIVFSVEAVLREELSDILEVRRASVIGYGRVGSSVAHVLRGRGVQTDVFDTDPIKRAEAKARGFVTHPDLMSALESKTLVVCATGNSALSKREHFLCLESECCIASVTSSDDELRFDQLQDEYEASSVSGNLTKYTSIESGKSFMMVANGNAANFIHGAVIGSAMQLIEGEKLACIRALLDQDMVSLKGGKDGFYELHQDLRKVVAEIWNRHF